MSHRSIIRDTSQARRDAYRKLEESGEQSEAIIEALDMLAKGGQSLGPKFELLLQKRAAIKAANKP